MTREKTVKRKLGLLKLAETLGDVAQACKVMGYSRDSFYRFKALYEQGGEMALQELSRRKPLKKNRVEAHIEEAVVAFAFDRPASGQQRVSNELKEQGMFISPGGVRSVWLRYDLETFQKRIEALEARVAQDHLILTEDQTRALEKVRQGKEVQDEIETDHPGCLGAQDTYDVSILQKSGRIYQQSFIDTYTQVAFARVYDRKNASVAVDVLMDRVMPFYEAQKVDLLRIFTDRGTEFCGTHHHEYQLYLAIEDIDHSLTRAKSPQTNRICQRFHKTVQDEFYAVAFREKAYDTLEALQADLDAWIEDYNTVRTHSGKYCFGKTPMQTFLDSKHLSQER